ncbi:MAG: dTDP-4-dehydrorhamnose reductase [Sphingomonas sp. SCN 67-18]|uniref:dTDP-4-dehydrorhamnose reductase n=1 Tax=uncultured Sphingomonas sp. TaxID=158754 RepID=UPI00086E6163|nr:dTDP-4-dehydrorhamnose reductase [Sphingomonas sp. SCN 67-18]ODU22395.1 MAG: dTDP-4-dehydrorhamnose reductase [Sphingomonas sp. SCN 67-18]
MSAGPFLVTGGTGQVGTGIARVAARRGIAIATPGRDALDLGDPASIDAAVKGGDWAAIINCAAYTAVDRAETERERAFAVNAEAPGHLARAAAARGIPIIHVSTDYVFDGGKDGFYDEADPVAPLGVYGASKEAGERAVRAANPRHIILRTAWVVSPWGQNFIRTMLRLGAERERIGVVADQIGCPSSAEDIADALLTIATTADPAWGTYHFVNAGQASWHDVAGAVFDRARAAGRKVPDSLDAIPTSAYPTPAKRPANSRLATAKIASAFAIAPRPWRDAIDAILTELLTEERVS